MAPEYGATMGFFPVDAETLAYLRFTGRDAARVRLVEEYTKAQGIFRTDATPDPIYTDKLELDLASVEPTLAGPKRPQDRVPLRQSKAAFEKSLEGTAQRHVAVKNNGDKFELSNGSVVIAAITSCTNTSNPSLMLGAGLLAKKAVERGLHSKPWVKTSLAPGSKVVTDYLEAAGLGKYLDQLGFNLVGYGCTTCIGNSGPLEEHIGAAIKDNSLVAVSVLSGNRNFEGRIHPLVRANYLASPPLVVAYALAGRMDFDMASEPLGNDKNGKPVFLRDIWPTPQEIESTVRASVTTAMYRKEYGEVFQGDHQLAGPEGSRGRSLRLGRQIHLHQESAVLRENYEDSAAAHRHSRRARAGDARQQHHDRSHFARRLDRRRYPGRKMAHRAGRQAGGLQLLRRAARQSRSDDARHVREYPPAQPARARHRGRLDRASARRREDVDLRRRDEISEGRRAADRARRQGIRLGIVARLGGQGHACCSACAP